MRSVFARTVVEAFLARREKGSAVSAADEQLVLDWETSGAPATVILEAVDDAFARKRSAPKSLAECNRWVRAAIARWSAAAFDGDTVGTEVPPPVAAPEADARRVARATPGAHTAPVPGSAPGRVEDPLREVLPGWLVTHVDGVTRGPLALAIRDVLDEAAAAAQGGRVSVEVARAIPLAIAAAALDALPASTREVVEAAVAARLGASTRGSDAARAMARARAVLDEVALLTA